MFGSLNPQFAPTGHRTAAAEAVKRMRVCHGHFPRPRSIVESDGASRAVNQRAKHPANALALPLTTIHLREPRSDLPRISLLPPALDPCCKSTRQCIHGTR